MIGLGKWKGNVSSKVFKGEIFFSISDNNGEDDIDIQMPEKFSKVKISFSDIKEEGAATLTGKAQVSILPGKELKGEFVFSGDTVEGVMKLPPLINIKITDGVKVS